MMMFFLHYSSAKVTLEINLLTVSHSTWFVIGARSDFFFCSIDELMWRRPPILNSRPANSLSGQSPRIRHVEKI